MNTLSGSPSVWRLQLTVRSGSDAGRSCQVDRDVVTVGKTADCDLVLNDPSVSRRHLRITRTGPSNWVLVDLGSTNGSFLGDTRVENAPIEPGAVLKAGRVEIAFLAERQDFEAPLWPEFQFGGLIGRSRPMRKLFGMIARIAATDATVLLEGETGTGKGAVARAIHNASARADRPFVVLDCGAVQRQLVESEFFGHEKGAFSGAYGRRQGAFELANRGTIFIDELGELELDMQPKLLRVLDAREVRRIGGSETVPVDLRIIGASPSSLSREVERGVFREDLFFRLSVITLNIPSMRDRAEDIPLLVEHFVKDTAEKRGVPTPKLDDAALDRLTSYDWPGNVRELRNVIERAVLLAAVRPGARLDVGRLEPSPAVTGPVSRSSGLSFEPGLSFGESKARYLAEKERRYVESLLSEYAGNVSAAARAASMDRKYLHKLIKKHGLSA
jgi:DNA-binding NtrC family response regulator